VPDALLDRIAALGFEWVYLLGVWQTGAAGRRVSRTHEAMRAGYPHDLPDWSDEDVCGSPFAITEYRVHGDFGGDEALATLRQRMRRKGLRVILDFVPNHTAIDHPWTSTHPARFIPGAHGGDGGGSWVDTLQLDYRNAELITAMIAELERIATKCDGIRADMAMLVHPQVFERNWGGKALDLWTRAIPQVKSRHPSFLFIAEAYYLHWELQQQGFDFTYDKVLYDRLVARDATAVRLHLAADHSFQKKLVRFLENHDEPRAARSFPSEVHRAAAVIAFFAPGLAFLHEGQLEGRRYHANIHLARRPEESVDAELAEFYERLIPLFELAEDDFWLCDPRPAWEGNPTHERFVLFRRGAMLIAVNFGPTRGQCYVIVSGYSKEVVLDDRLEGARYLRNGEELATRGLFLDMPAWGHHVFVIEPT
jgi:glycosidase